MPEFTSAAGRRDARRHGARGPGGMRGFHLLIALLPAALLAVAGAGAVAFLLTGPHPAGVTRTVLITAAAVAAIVLAAAAWGAMAATGRLRGRLAALRSVSVRSQADLLLLAERVQQGERPALRAPDPVPGAAGDPFVLLARDLQQERHAAREALLQVVLRMPGGRADLQAEVSAGFAARMQSLVHQEIELLGGLKGQVLDPAVLQGLLAVDHLATRTRRQLESLAVVAGAGPLRQWTQSMTLHDVLQAAAAEVEYSARVTVVPPLHGTLQPGAVADVMHLVAELIDNASRFSDPHARTLVRADTVAVGLAVEVEDRGSGMMASDRHRINALLSHPDRAEARQLLSGGHTGLFVVSELARRHGIEVQLQGNIYGGTQAVVVLPGDLLEGGPASRQEPAAEGPAAPVPPAAPAEPGAAVPDAAAAAQHNGGPVSPAQHNGGPVSDDTPVMFRRVIPPPPSVTEWPEPPPPPPPLHVPPPPAPPEPLARPASGQTRQAGDMDGNPLLPAGAGQPHPAPPPQDEQEPGSGGPVTDRIADLMAAFRNPAGQEDPDQRPG